MSTLKDQVERIQRQQATGPNVFGSFDYESVLGGAKVQISYDAFVYFSDALPQREIRCGEFRLLGHDSVVEESVNLLPGCLVVGLGFIPIGATSGGNIYVLDCESGKVFEISHEKYNKASISPGWKPDFSAFLPDVPITRENVINTAEQVFDDVGQFLEFLAQQDELMP